MMNNKSEQTKPEKIQNQQQKIQKPSKEDKSKSLKFKNRFFKLVILI